MRERDIDVGIHDHTRNRGNLSSDTGNGLRVAVLGRVRAWINGHEVVLGTPRQRSCLAVLAAHANRVMSQEDLIDAVWGASAPPTAKGSVYTYISKLRRALERRGPRGSHSEILMSTPAGYTLRLGSGALDADRFIALRRQAQELLAHSDREGAVGILREALGLWHGEAFSGVTGPFVEWERDRLGELRLATIEQQARLAIEIDDHDEVAAELTVLVREHPLNEALHELLMLALHGAGRHAEALEEYRQTRQTFIRELGIEPGPSLQAVHRQILGGTAQSRGTSLARPARASNERGLVIPSPVAGAINDGLVCWPLVGRTAELNVLRSLTATSAGGKGRAVWIDGEAGIGKSELLAAALSDAAERGFQVAWGVADELKQRIPLQVIVEALGLASPSSDPRLPALTEDIHKEPVGSGGEIHSAITTERILAHVRQRCSTAPLIVVIDDMQWADEATRFVWERLAASARQLPLLVIAAARPTRSGRELAQLRRGVQARQGYVLTLSPLSSSDTELLIGEIVGAHPGANLRELATRTAGNPRYTREWVSELVQQSAVTTIDGVADIAGDAADRAPQSLLTLVRSTLDTLSFDTRSVLRLAALIGTKFSMSDVAAVTGNTPFELVRTMDEAVAARVVIEAGDELAFHHPLLRQALIGGLPRTVRAALHQHAAEALADAGRPVVRVAEQLVAEPAVINAKMATWFTDHHAAVAAAVPAIAAQLTQQVDVRLAAAEQRVPLLVAPAGLLHRVELPPASEDGEAAGVEREPAGRTDMQRPQISPPIAEMASTHP